MPTDLRMLGSDIAWCMLRDQHRLRQRLRGIERASSQGRVGGDAVDQIAREIERSLATRTRRQQNRPNIAYPQELPVAQRKDEIAQTIAKHQVTILAGETGSGKTTQLPKICLELGRGISGMIGHTQPRRIAARSVATRIAQEIGTELGHHVGYKVRFGDHVSVDHTYIKLMTDGILLAETQNDRFLDQYDTIIIDEAHERSLNIDFLIGYLKQLLPKRPDLKLIITSATIDPQRFSRHFDDAPVLEVSGRTYPVEVRHRDLSALDPDEEDVEQIEGILRAVDELSREGTGDILVFLTGEREIRETAEALRKHHPSGTEIIALYARLAAHEQMRVFQPGPRRRIVLATNVAETSLTVPRIHYVIDPGNARISRYSSRNKVQRLPIEPISQASANQRKGRCGRVAAGVCIRLYSQEEFASRPEFTEPEILRTNLASVILQMKALHLGAVEDFPFLEPPEPRQIRDGYATLHELGAVNGQNELTDIGRAMARLPVDPRIARMILAAREENVMEDVLIIAAALSVQDPRDRPLDQQEPADQAHAKFRDQGSDFLTYLNLWQWFHQNDKHLSGSKLRKACREHFVSFMRMREWHDVHQQLREQVMEMGLGEMRSHARSPRLRAAEHPMNAAAQDITHAAFDADRADAIHRALLTGLLSNIGMKGDTHEYTGARGNKFSIFPGSRLFKRKPAWVMAGEIVETAKVYARTIAPVRPEWIERAGAHLLKRSYVDPHWQSKSAHVVAYEKVTLYGLVLVPRRLVHYGPIDPVISREIFINHALVDFDFKCAAPFFRHNRDLVEHVELLEAKARRRNLLADPQTRFAWYQARVGMDIYNGPLFEKWRRDAEKANPMLLFMQLPDLLKNDAGEITQARFPDTMRVGNMELPLSYRFDPAMSEDGVTITVPLGGLNQLRPAAFSWLVPGMLQEKILELIRSLPKGLRVRFVPAPDTATAAFETIKPGDGALDEALAAYLGKLAGQRIAPSDFDVDSLAPHLKMNFKVIDPEGKSLAMGRDLLRLQRELGAHAQQDLAGVKQSPWIRDGITSWDFGDPPAQIDITRHGLTMTAYPAIVDHGTSVSLRLLESAESARQASRKGVRRLLAIQLREEMKYLGRSLPDFEQLAIQFSTIGDSQTLKRELLAAIVERALFPDDGEVRTREQFIARAEDAWKRLSAATHEVVDLVAAVLKEYHEVARLVAGSVAPGWREGFADIEQQIEYLLPPDFITRTPFEWLRQLPRFVKAIHIRLKKLTDAGVMRDSAAMAQVKPWWEKYLKLSADYQARGLESIELDRYRWMVEELRVSLFAQQLKTSIPISSKRLERQLDAIKR